MIIMLHYDTMRYAPFSYSVFSSQHVHPHDDEQTPVTLKIINFSDQIPKPAVTVKRWITALYDIELN